MLNDECGWKDGDRSAVGLQNVKENADGSETTTPREPGRKYRDGSLPFSPSLLYGSRPPVQAPPRLATLGLVQLEKLMLYLEKLPVPETTQ